MLCSTPKELSAAVADHSAVLASVGASILPQFKLAFTAFPCLKVTFGWICSLTSYFSFSPSSSQRMSCLSNWASNSGSVMPLMSVARSNLRSVDAAGIAPGPGHLSALDRILIRTSLRQVFCTLQVTSPVSGLWLCRVEHRATAHCRRVSRSFFSSSVSGALVVAALGSWAAGTARARRPAPTAQATTQDAHAFWACFVSLDRAVGRSTRSSGFSTQQATGNMTGAQRFDQTRPSPDASSRHSTMRSKRRSSRRRYSSEPRHRADQGAGQRDGKRQQEARAHRGPAPGSPPASPTGSSR